MGCKKGRRKPHHYDPNSIPEDLLIDQILPRLPIKSLARFKSVSKNWNSHISCNPFNPKTPSKIIIHPYSAGLPISIFTFVDQQLINNIHPYQITNTRSYFTVIGSCNGLICLSVSCRAGDFFLICNPITQETRQIRDPRGGYHSYYHGFAYDSSLNDYKLVLIGRSYQLARLFSLRDSRWRKLQLPIESRLHFANCITSQTILVGETLHWLLRNNTILAFDSVKESFFWVPLPHCPYLKNLLRGRDLFLCNIKDCLCVCSLRTRGSDNEPFLLDAKFDLEVWILEEYGVWDSWKILLSLNYLQEFFKRKCDIYPNLFELRNHGNGNLFCILGNKEGLLMINSNGGAYHYHSIKMHGLPFVHAESLISPFYYGRRQLNRKAKEGKKIYW